VRALVTSKPGVIGLASPPEPMLTEPGQAIVRVERVGLCGSDLHLFNGDLGAAGELYPRIQGHEVSAIVEQVAGPRDPGLVPGQRVAVLPVFSCGACYPCRIRRPNVCTRLAVLGVHRDGALADRMLIPAGNLVAAVHAVRRGRVAAGEHVIVFGGGPIGQATCLAAVAAGAEVMVVEPLPGRRDAALRTGATAVSSAGSPEVHAEITNWCHGEAPEVAIDTTGAPAAFQTALTAVTHGGRLVAVGLSERAVSYPVGILAHREIDVLGVSCCTRADFTRAAELVAASVPVILPLISHRIRIDEVEAALPRIGTPETMKIVVDMSAW
jgi:threonine dehydrogenase-like Zn-dependent dehydrogenase